MKTHQDARTTGEHRHGMHVLAALLIATLLLLGVCSSHSVVEAHGSAGVAADTIDQDTLLLGAQVFQGKSGGALCTTCHGATGKGISGLGPDLTDDTWLHGDGKRAFLEDVIRRGVVRPVKSAATMPPMGGGSLSDAQVKAVAAYVQSLARARTTSGVPAGALPGEAEPGHHGRGRGRCGRPSRSVGTATKTLGERTFVP